MPCGSEVQQHGRAELVGSRQGDGLRHRSRSSIGHAAEVVEPPKPELQLAGQRFYYRQDGSTYISNISRDSSIHQQLQRVKNPRDICPQGWDLDSHFPRCVHLHGC